MADTKKDSTNSSSENIGFNIHSFIENDPQKKDVVIPEIVTDPVIITQQQAAQVIAPKRRGRKPKSESSDAVVVTETPQNSMAYIQQNIPYEVAFRDTNTQLDETINQLNSLGHDTMIDLSLIRSNKTLKNKFVLISNLTEQAVSIINTKLNAIREKNKIIGDINNLELKRLKDLKMDTNQQDPDARIADLYSAFVNTPIGTMNGTGLTGMMAPTQQSMMMPMVQPDFNRGTIMPNGMISDVEQATWQNNLDPAQQRMLLQAQGTMDICVIYDEATGARRFAAINKATGQEMTGVELPNQDSVWELNLNLNMKMAKDTNRGITYPVMIINTNI